MSKTRLAAGTFLVLVAVAITAVASVSATAKPAKSAGERQARLHHEVPRRLLLHPRRRREDVAEDAQERQRHLRPGQVGDRRCRRDRRDPGHGRERRQGNRDHADQPGGDPRAQEGGQGRGQGRADGQRPADLEGRRRRSSRRTTSKGGKLAGKWLATKLKAGDTLGILEGVPGVPALDDRVTGMLAGLGALKSKIKVVSKLETDCDQTKGAAAAQTMLTANPNLTAIYSACGPPALGAIQSIKNAGIKPGGIILVGFDGSAGRGHGRQGRHRERHGRAASRRRSARSASRRCTRR